MKRTEDEDDALTFRRQESRWPSSSLEESVSATILRLAKENFRKRDLSREQESPEYSSDVKAAGKGESLPSEDELRLGIDDQQSESKRTRSKRRSFSPMVSTNDELSYELIRPSTRFILEKLDKTLSILHNARVATVRHDNDTSASEDEDAVTRSRGRPRASSRGVRGRSQSIAPTEEDRDPSVGPQESKRRVGRPSKTHQPKEGETHREFLIRRAREQHKRLPTFSDEESDTEAKSGDVKKAEAKRRRQRSRSRSRSQRTPMQEDDNASEPGHISEWRLRDWSDVIGAAGLAGFSSTVIARATERCVDLFGEGMEIHTLNEVGAGRDADVFTTRFEPGVPGTEDSIKNEEDVEEDANIARARLMSRQSSMAPSDSPSSGSEDEVKIEEAKDVSMEKRTEPSSPRTQTAARFYCTRSGCKRAIQGFRRRNNLVRHMRLVHSEILEDRPETEESADEMDGAVHVDGFLKPIKPRPGWRADDTRKRSRSRKSSREPQDDVSR